MEEKTELMTLLSLIHRRLQPSPPPELIYLFNFSPVSQFTEQHLISWNNISPLSE